MTPEALSEALRAQHAGAPHCRGCGSQTATLRVVLVVPEEAGGRRHVDNAALLCLRCSLRGALSSTDASGRKYVTFWVSDRLASRLTAARDARKFPSVNALVNALILRHVEDPTALDTSLNDPGSDTKLMGKVDAELYARFQQTVTGQQMTATDALKALLLQFLREVHHE